MKLRLTLLMTLLACAIDASAGIVTNWHTFKAAPATTLSGQGTGNPVMGSTNLTANSSFLIGYFDKLSLTNLGDRITLSFQVSFTDAAGMANAGDNFRFAMYDLNGQTPVTAENTATAGVDGQTDNWRGYWFGVRNGSGTGSGGSIRKRFAALTSATDNPFSNTAANPATSLGPVGGSSVTLQSATEAAGGPSYFGVMALEKTPTGVAIGGYYFGGTAGTNIFIANDDTSPTPTSYAAVGYLAGNGLSCDQFNFQNVSVNYSFSNALQITSQPSNVTVNAGASAQFSVSWTGSGLNPTFQWRENGSPIFDATNSTYTIPVTVIGQNNNTYSVVIQNVFGDSVTSSEAMLTVISDTAVPTVLSASSLVSNSVNVIFSEPVDPITSQDSGNYSLAGNSISSVTLIGTTNVLVTVDNLITTNFTLAVQNVKDAAGNTMSATNLAGIAHGFQESITVQTPDGTGFAFNEKIVVHAGGSDIFGSGDQFHYVYKTVSGDFDLAVRVESLLDNDPNAKAGLMARVNTFFDSRNVMIEATPGRFIFQYRTNTAGGNSFAAGAPRPATAFPNCWVRLVRTGAIITGYSSTNNATWVFMGSYDTAIDADGAYPTDILVGLAATAHDLAEVTKAVFSDFGQTAIIPSLTINNVGGNVELSWPAAAIGFALEATPSLSTPITWTNVPGSSATNRVNVPIGAGASYFRLMQ